MRAPTASARSSAMADASEHKRTRGDYVTLAVKPRAQLNATRPAPHMRPGLCEQIRMLRSRRSAGDLTDLGGHAGDELLHRGRAVLEDPLEQLGLGVLGRAAE